ncbi:MAG: Uncharacterized protein G01um101493_135 [Microgenomates group bacterium Gr01-1014_93]|nr:MAG: Uncharacterized protein G01um101493_135 [Microgenomates group bacterium Gr01-1014_93]
MSKIIPIFFLIVGLAALYQVASPILSYKLWEVKLHQDLDTLISPQKGKEQVLGISIEKDSENFSFFNSNIKRNTPALFNVFLLTIPKLSIFDAKVFVDSNDLQKGLAHLAGSALPGEEGNVFISGHSALPILFNGNKNYGAIFANLNKANKGDEIKVKVLDTEFIYTVSDIKIISPNDLSVIQPPDSTGRYITLMTCVPPGLNTKRLIVIGKLK